MSFEFTPEDAQAIALTVAKEFTRKRLHVDFEIAPWSDAPYRPTITAQDGEKKILVEAQKDFNFHREMKELAMWLMVRRYYAENFIATTPKSTIPAGTLEEMRELGVGIILVDGDKLSVYSASRIPALIVSPDPTLRYGPHSGAMKEILYKFNYVNRKDALRDMCELVEKETEQLLLTAITQAKMQTGITASTVLEKDWAEQIDTLGSTNASKSGAPIIADKLKTDLHSFRGARNLLKHKTRNRKEENARQRQFMERMAQGPRLLSELLALVRKIKR
jgi:hypothetical protein